MTRKRLAALGLSMAMCISLVGCGKNGISSGSQSTSSAKSSVKSGNAIAEVVSLSAVDTSDMFSDRDLSGTYDESAAIGIVLDKTGATVSDTSSVVVSEGLVTIKKEGTYILTGSFTGQIKVDVADENAKVQLVLKDVTLTNTSSAAIYALSADKVFITAVGTSDVSTTGDFVKDSDVNIDGAIFAKTDITFNGTGTINVTCSKGHGIVSKDDLKITSGTYVINAGGDGIQGKDSVRIADGDITIVADGDGIQSKNDDKDTKGYVYIEGGTFDITTGGGSKNASVKTDNMQQFGRNFNYNQSTSSSESSDDTSTKGIKASYDLIIAGGTFDLDTCDDAIHSDSNIVISGGELNITAGDDGIHADGSVGINDGTINITKSYEGIEGLNITVAGGTLDVVSSDDGFNATDGSGSEPMMGRGGQNQASSSSNVYLKITGGDITVNCDGDGLDANGSLYVSGGNTVVYGQANGGNGALDYDSTAQITGGTVIAIGFSQMAQNFGSSSTQGSILYNLTSYANAGTTITLKDSDGKVLASTTSPKQFNSVVISTPDIKSGKTYTLTVGNTDYTITMSSLIYGAGEEGMGGMQGGMQGGRQGGMQGDMQDGRQGGMQGDMQDGMQGGGRNRGDMNFPQDGNFTMPDGEMMTPPDGEMMTFPNGTAPTF